MRFVSFSLASPCSNNTGRTIILGNWVAVESSS